MENNKNIIDDHIIFRSLGMDLGENDSDSVVNENDDQVQKTKEYNEIASMLPSLLDDVNFDKALSSEKKDTIFDNILSEIDKKSKLEKKHENFSFVFDNDSEWIDYPIKGIKYKPLSLNKEKNYLMLLLKAEAGCQYPSHHHSGAEECYVIQGDLCAEGKVLGPGDFHHAEGDSDHKSLYTKTGCTLLIVADPEDYA